MIIWLIIAIASLAALVYALEANAAALDTVSPGIAAALVILVLIAAYGLISKSRAPEQRGGGWNAATAAVVIAGLLAAAKFSGVLPLVKTATDDASKPAGRDLSAGAPAAVKLRKRNDGAYLARGSINGVATEFIVDSGAATIMLKQSDAQKAGVDVSALAFDTPIQTAAGTTYVAPVQLRGVAIGPLVLDNLEALVARPGSLNENLLGQNFLRRLSSYEVSGDFMTLRK